jgi:ATP-dependent protease ClpP protease subunit
VRGVPYAWRMSVADKTPELPSNRRRLSAWLQERLFERRIVLVAGRLDADLATEAAAALMTLDAMGEEPIELHLDSADGTLEAAFVLIEIVDLLRTTLRVQCRGEVGGPAIGVAAAADYRSASPHTRFRLFQPTTQFSGPPDPDRVVQSPATGAALEASRPPRPPHGPACRGDRRGHAARALPRRHGSTRLWPHR